MSVTVKFFASLRDDIGVAQTSVVAASVSDLLSALGEVLGADKVRQLQRENVRIAVNQSLIAGECALFPGDEVAFLPPVTGG